MMQPKLKERLTADQLKGILGQWIEALDQESELELEINGKRCHIPSQAFQDGMAEVEVDSDKGELEIELKWKPEGSSSAK
jgi:hypothetical protein